MEQSNHDDSYLTFLKRVWTNYRGITALAGAVTVGAVGTFLLMPWINAFNRVETNHQNIQNLKKRVESIETVIQTSKRERTRQQLGLRMVVCDSEDAKENETIRTIFACDQLDEDMSRFRYGKIAPIPNSFDGLTPNGTTYQTGHRTRPR